jgi:hypothetical protein
MLNKILVEKDWITKAGLRAVCVVVSFENGPHHRCGYVAVQKGHKLFGAHYDAVEVDVHGGLTFSELNNDNYPVASDENWWFGFDCAHGCDGEITPSLYTPGQEGSQEGSQEKGHQEGNQEEDNQEGSERKEITWPKKKRI